MSRPRNSESVFRAIADPTRRRMIDLLHNGERSVGDLLSELRIRKSTATFHLGSLMNAGLVRQRRRGRHLMCVLDVRSLHAAHAWLSRHVVAHARATPTR